MKKLIIVTGANKGLGKAIVDRYLQMEDTIIISISRRLAEGQENLAAEQFRLFKTDLAKDNIISKVSALLDYRNKVSELLYINNAATVEPIGRVGTYKSDDIENSLIVNCLATVAIVNFLLANFPKDKISLINITSGAASKPLHSWALYCSSKAYLNHFFQVVKLEAGIKRLINFDPGILDTDMQEQIRNTDFPNRQYFVDYKRKGDMKSPQQAAGELLNLI